MAIQETAGAGRGLGVSGESEDRRGQYSETDELWDCRCKEEGTREVKN